MESPLGPLMPDALMPPWGIVSFAAVFGCHATLPGALRNIQKTAAKKTTLGIVAAEFLRYVNFCGLKNQPKKQLEIYVI